MKKIDSISPILLIKMKMDQQHPHIPTALRKIPLKHKDPRSQCHQPNLICYSDHNQQQSFQLFTTYQWLFPTCLNSCQPCSSSILRNGATQTLTHFTVTTSRKALASQRFYCRDGVRNLLTNQHTLQHKFIHYPQFISMPQCNSSSG